MCKKQTAVSHSSTESEIISLDTGLRLDGLHALEWWDLIVSVFGSVSQISDRTGRPANVDVKRNQKSQGKINVMENIDSVPSNVQSARQEALLYVFEDTEAVIKMIIKGRSPTMRHVSRTHRVALDWLFDRINLDSEIQIRYIDTKNQLADMLTEGNFTRDEWNNLLYLFNISHFSPLCCSQNFSLTSCTKTMANRMQEQEGENRIVAKSKPTTMNLAVSVSTSSSTVQNPIASKSPGILKAPCQKDGLSTRKLDAKEHTNQDAASSSQRWQKDVVLDVVTRKLVATEEDQEHLNYPEDSISTRKLVASGNSETEGMTKFGHTISIYQINYVPHMWQRYCLSPRDPEKNLDVNAAIWCIFLSVTLQAAVHLGKPFTREFAIYQESIQDISETVISSDWEVDHGSCRNYWLDNDWLAAARVERDGSADWQSCSVCSCKQPTSSLTQCFVWEVSVLNQSKHGKARKCFFGNTLLKKCGSDGAVEQTRSSATMWDMLRWIDVQMWVNVSFLKRTWAWRRCGWVHAQMNWDKYMTMQRSGGLRIENIHSPVDNWVKHNTTSVSSGGNRTITTKCFV